MSTLLRLLTWQMEEAKIAKALQTTVGCIMREPALCSSVLLLTVKLLLGTMKPLGLVRMEPWTLSFPLMLNTRGRRALPSGVGPHPAWSIELL